MRPSELSEIEVADAQIKKQAIAYYRSSSEQLPLREKVLLINETALQRRQNPRAWSIEI